jgi:Tol biopolymer transport system component
MASLTDIIKSAGFVRGAGFALALGAAFFPIKSSADEDYERILKEYGGLRIAGLYIIDAEGKGEPIRISEEVIGFWDNIRYAWSPDGTKIVLANNAWPVDCNLHIIDTRTLESRVIEIPQKAGEYAKFIDNLCWSSDGWRIAFDSHYSYRSEYGLYCEDRNKVCVINIDGNYREIVSDGLTTYKDASWFWDGSWFVYTVSPKSEEYPLEYIAKVKVSANPSEDEVIPLTEPDSNTRYPEVSPDGKHIVYYKELSTFRFQQRGEWWIMDSDGTNKRLLRPSNPYEDEFDYIGEPVWCPVDNMLYPPAWSPDETLFLAFNSWVGEQYFSDAEIRILNLKGEICQIIRPKEPGKNAFVQELSPDQTRMIISSDENGYYGLFILDLRTNVPRQITFDRFCYEPQWSPDGKHIAYVLERIAEEE